ncbi:MAG: hypothetical protein JRN21_09895 [Nitrososphaerota archaeon]|nr:hypothetical protein [Nitrososphaerota archaeon]
MSREEKEPQWLSALIRTWNQLESSSEGRKLFGGYLVKLGFSRSSSGSFKDAYISHDKQLVIKWDLLPEKNKTREHTWTEFVTWRNAPESKRKYLAPVIRYSNGLMLQTMVRECGEQCSSKMKVMLLASMLKTSHWYHHGHVGVSTKFFDYDSVGLIDDDVAVVKALESEVQENTSAGRIRAPPIGC